MSGATGLADRARARASSASVLLLVSCLAVISTACGPAHTADVAAIEFRLSGAPMLIGEVDLPEGGFTLMLPSDLAAGDFVSGRVHVSTSNDEGTMHVPAAPGRALADFQVVIGRENFALSGHEIRLRVEEAATGLRVALLDGDGQLRAEGLATVARRPADSMPPRGLGDLPAYCSSTGAIILTGSFDGDSRNTRVEIGEESVEIWTESPRQATALAFGLPAGLSDFRVAEGETEIQGSIHVLQVEIEPRSLEAEPGTRVPYLVVVDGLEGLDAPQPPILGLSAWTENGVQATVQRDTVVHPELAENGRVVIRGEFTAAETGTFHINGGIRRAPPTR